MALRDDELIAYYGRRAPEYEAIYQRPERRADLIALAERIRELLAGGDVLEVACGTGYWTERFATVARSVVATDIGGEVLEIARGKHYPPGRVSFAIADAFHPPELPGRFTGGVAGFWWSHVPRSRLGEFLGGLGRCLAPAARVVLFDNRYVPGESLPITRRDAAGDTYQQRRLADGSQHEVRKNFPDAGELQAAAAPFGADLAITEWRYFWCLTYLHVPR